MTEFGPFRPDVDLHTGLTTHWAWLKQPMPQDHLVAYVDIDQTKHINDYHGLPTGDAVVVEMAARIKTHPGPGEKLYRMGGDEFMVVYSLDLSLHLVKARVVALQQLWETPFEVEGKQLQVTAGIVVTILHDLHPEDFRKRVGVLMAQNKTRGKNQLLFA